MSYKQGFLDGLAAYAWWKDGEQRVGTLGRTLKDAQAAAEKTWNYAPPPEVRRQVEDQPFAWAVTLKSGVQSLCYHPHALELQEGDVAYPLFREVYTQEALDAAEKRSAERHGKLRTE